jgi:Rps23 Pro-64 3,4-dihydroxylase Tpa1-like proline 4-hydroxylase
MKVFNKGLSETLCDQLYNFAMSYVYASEICDFGYPRPVVTSTNMSWDEGVREHSHIAILYTVPQPLCDLVSDELIDLGIISLGDDVSGHVTVFTPGSYIPPHKDGKPGDNRKPITAYLNKDWSIHNGGMFHYKDEDTQEWKTISPERGLLVYNDSFDWHYTTPVLGNNLRITLQMFLSSKE